MKVKSYVRDNEVAHTHVHLPNLGDDKMTKRKTSEHDVCSATSTTTTLELGKLEYMLSWRNMQKEY